MIFGTKHQKAQVIGEYSIAFFIVVTAVMGMVFFLQRGFQARVNDARAYVSETLDGEADLARVARGQSATSGVLYSYEPYYQKRHSIVERAGEENVIFSGSAGSYVRRQISNTAIEGYREEAPARDDF